VPLWIHRHHTTALTALAGAAPAVCTEQRRAPALMTGCSSTGRRSEARYGGIRLLPAEQE